ncbi:tetratricopeptide repeat protein [Actinoplanes subglobosus]|uniref:Tetratricopeptide repeat protein n=1 Tax=Actinoplanes subglobosus TaxID=1547892 RepID=A0ABV8IRC6_9ACTN
MLLAGAAVLFWWQPGSRQLPKPGWTGTEQAGWIAGIAGAVFGLAALVITVLDRRDARRQERAKSAPTADRDGAVRVGLVPREADYFQDREVVRQLLRAAGAGRAAARTQVLSGLGGVGKTQVAAQFTRHLDAAGELDVRVWITADTRQALLAGYAALARSLRLPGISTDTDPQAAAEQLLRWLEHTDKRWLIVLDNLDLPADMAGLWPPDNPRGRSLITTRRRDAVLTGGNRTMITVGLYSMPEAIAHLTAATGTTSPPADIEALANALGLLPLAIAQAAAYIRDRDIDCATYLALLRRHGLTRVLPPEDALPDDHRTTVAATWILSVQAADRLSPRGLARPLLNLAAMLDPNTIPTSLFTTVAVAGCLAAEHAGPPDGQAVDDALSNLHRLHLITHDRVSGSIRVHALVQHATRDQLSPDQQATTARIAADALAEIWPGINRDPAQTQLLYANTTALTTNTGDALLTPDLHPLLLRAAQSLGETSQATAAIGALERLLADCLRVLGPDHPDTLTIRHNLAWFRGEAGDPDGAADAFEQLLTDHLRTLGPDHPHTLTSRNNIAWWRGRAGDPDGAAAAFEQLLADRRRVLGHDHPHTLTSRGNLAYWRGESGDPEGAATTLERLLTDYLRVLGPDHPDTLTTRHNLARFRGEAGDPDGAVDALERLFTDYLRVLGPDHPGTLYTRYNLARWRGESGDPDGAVDALEQVLADYLRVLGPDHPDTVNARHLRTLWQHQAVAPDGALADSGQPLTDQPRRVAASDHPEPRIARRNLAYWQGQVSD